MSFLVHSASVDGLAATRAIWTLKITMEFFQPVDLSFAKILEIEMLQGQVPIGFRLTILIVFKPSDLQHSLESNNCGRILHQLLIHPAELFIYQNGFLVVIGIFCEVTEIFEYFNGLLRLLYFI